MDKKGFLLGEETVKIIISVIVIAFLIYFLTSLYFAHEKNKDLELAESSLDQLVSSINEGASSVEIYNPTNKVLFTWPMYTEIDDEIEEVMPQSCEIKGWDNCICICGVNHLKQNIESEEERRWWEKALDVVTWVPRKIVDYGVRPLAEYFGIWDNEIIEMAERCSSDWVCKESQGEVIAGVKDDGDFEGRLLIIENPPLELNLKYEDEGVLIIKDNG